MIRRSLASLALFACAVHAGPTAAPVRAEIDAMLAQLESSGCEFNRAGTWHAGAQAKAHLLRKLAYMEGEGTIQSAEQFIELAGSTSSTSGEPYLVRCGSAAPVASAAWLLSQLQAMRSRARGASAPR